MRLIHSAPRGNADRILATGFEDRSEERQGRQLYKGSWLSDGPLEGFDAYLEVHLADALIAPYKLSSDLHGYRRWVTPSAILNNCT
jgi:hypothetical protein